jgi:hypothetical protein
METIENFFIANFTSIALYRSGNATGPRLNQVRIPPKEGTIDIEIYEKEVNGEKMIYVDSTSGGISTFDAPLPSQNKKVRWWKIPAGTIIPHGLIITKDHSIESINITHYTIRPLNDMPLTEYKKLLRILAQKALPTF